MSSKQRETHRTTFGKGFSEGARQLWLALDKKGWGREELTSRLGCSRGATSRWLYGDRVPDTEWLHKIEDLLGIPSRAWRQSAAKVFTPPHLKAG